MNELFTKHRIDYIIHGDDPCLLPDGSDAYAHAKKLGRFKMVGRGGHLWNCVRGAELAGRFYRPGMILGRALRSLKTCGLVESKSTGRTWHGIPTGQADGGRQHH